MRKSRGHGRRRHARHGAGIGLVFALMLVSSGTAAAVGAVGYLLWPRWPNAPTAKDAPSLPIVVNGVAFNVPPAAIRHSTQRRPGAQERLDLAFQWPGLQPPDPNVKPTLASDFRLPQQLFITIARPQASLPLKERIRTIYPRYLSPTAFPGPKGLNGVSFRDGTPYQGEDLLYDPQSLDSFLVRCTRDTAATQGSCILERNAGAAELTVRFPRELLEEWSQLADGVGLLLTSLQAGS